MPGTHPTPSGENKIFIYFNAAILLTYWADGCIFLSKAAKITAGGT